jgi:cyclophilin family peptidyl-prolyl cis-trans isomerase
MSTARLTLLAGAGLALAIGLAACGGKAPSDPPLPTTCSVAGTAAGTATTLTNAVCLLTSQGEIVVELDATRAPATVANFLRYVDDRFYDGTKFHRVIPTYIIQGGGYTTSGALKTPTYGPIPLESTNGWSNTRGTLAMARLLDVPDSATTQFFFNLEDNPTLNDDPVTAGPDGFAVFGQVLLGMDAVDRIGALHVLSSQEPYPMVTLHWAKRVK